jgi:regulator of protease activity HflC (stomatin/prohibitin superfamily)
MPSDQDEKGTMWQDKGTGTGQTMQQLVAPADVQAQAPADTHGQLKLVPPLSEAAQDQTFPPGLIDTDNFPLLDPDDVHTESNLLHLDQHIAFSRESLRTIGRQLSPILWPLPCALLVFLMTLPMTSHGGQQAGFPLSALVTGLILLALAFLQGTLLYVASTHTTFWLSSLVLGYLALIVVGVLAAWGVGAALLVLVLLLVVVALLARRSFHVTPGGHVDLVEAFGTYNRTLYPGLGWLLPWESTGQRMNTQETTWTTELQHVPISRDQDVQFTATVVYQLMPEDAHLAARFSDPWDQRLRTEFLGIVQSVVNGLTPEDLITWNQSNYSHAPGTTSSFNPAIATRWDLINDSLKRRLQDQVADWGVEIIAVYIRDLLLLPHVPDHSQSKNQAQGPGQSQAAAPAPQHTPAPAAPEQTTPARTQDESPTRPPVSSAAPAPAPAAAGIPIPQLVVFYDSVRNGKITDPDTILSIAQRFDELADDPQLDQKFPYDARRAAASLRTCAQQLQEGIATNTRNP